MILDFQNAFHFHQEIVIRNACLDVVNVVFLTRSLQQGTDHYNVMNSLNTRVAHTDTILPFRVGEAPILLYS